MDGWMDGWTKARTVCEWMGWAMAWIRPRLVEFIACNLHNSISVGSSEMLIARKKVAFLGPPGRQTAHLGTVCSAGKRKPDRVRVP